MMSRSMRNITYVTNADMIWELMIGRLLNTILYAMEVTAVSQYRSEPYTMTQ